MWWRRDEAEWERVVTQEHVEQYAAITGDMNPLVRPASCQLSISCSAVFSCAGAVRTAGLAAARMPSAGGLPRLDQRWCLRKYNSLLAARSLPHACREIIREILLEILVPRPCSSTHSDSALCMLSV